MSNIMQKGKDWIFPKVIVIAETRYDFEQSVEELPCWCLFNTKENKITVNKDLLPDSQRIAMLTVLTEIIDNQLQGLANNSPEYRDKVRWLLLSLLISNDLTPMRNWTGGDPYDDYLHYPVMIVE